MGSRIRNSETSNAELIMTIVNVFQPFKNRVPGSVCEYFKLLLLLLSPLLFYYYYYYY